MPLQTLVATGWGYGATVRGGTFWTRFGSRVADQPKSTAWGQAPRDPRSRASTLRVSTPRTSTGRAGGLPSRVGVASTTLDARPVTWSSSSKDRPQCDPQEALAGVGVLFEDDRAAVGRPPGVEDPFASRGVLVDGANGLGVDVENLEFALVLLVTSMSAIERLSGDHAEVLDGVARVHPWQEGRLTLEAHAAPKLHHERA